jgi:hypothetical protein
MGVVGSASAPHHTFALSRGSLSIGYRVLTAHLLPGPAADDGHRLVDSRASTPPVLAGYRLLEKPLKNGSMWLDGARACCGSAPMP